MDTELIAVCAVQIFVLALVVMAIVVYLLRNLMCRSRLDVVGRTLVITGCDSTLGFDLARRYDQLGFRVYAGFDNTAGEAAVRLQADASSRLRIIPLDVTCTSSLAAAAKLVKEQLPPSEKGQSCQRIFLLALTISCFSSFFSISIYDISLKLCLKRVSSLNIHRIFSALERLGLITSIPKLKYG